MDEQHAWLACASIPGLHAGLLRRLSNELGSIAAVLSASCALLESLNVRAPLAARIASAHQFSIEQSLRWLETPTNSIVTATSTDYPPLLAQLNDAPPVLFVQGDVGSLRMPQLAIVGSRNPTPAGRETAEAFAAHLARAGLTITSGLALGVDAASHRGALKVGGKTVAVCGTGLDTIYPREHELLAQQIVSHGALVSEFAPGVQATRFNFPRRNRLISGLSLGTLIVEAALKSGSLITARLASEQGREVFAIPGSIHNALSKGCHQLIRQGAHLVETAQDIFDELAPLAATLLDLPATALSGHSAERAEVFPAQLDKEYKILLDAVGFEPAGVDVVIHRTGFKADEVASMLLILELQGLIESYPGGLYIRARPEAVK